MKIYDSGQETWVALQFLNGNNASETNMTANSSYNDANTQNTNLASESLVGYSIVRNPGYVSFIRFRNPTK